MSLYILIETYISLSNTDYFVHENNHHVPIFVISSTVASVEFVVELHSSIGSASGMDLPYSTKPLRAKTFVVFTVFA